MEKIKNTWVRGNTHSQKNEETKNENGKVIYESGWKKGIYQSKKNNIRDELKNLHNAFKVKMGWKSDNPDIRKNIQSPIQKSNAKIQESVDLNRESRKMLGELEITNENQLDFQPYSNITTQTKNNHNEKSITLEIYDDEPILMDFEDTYKLNNNPSVEITTQDIEEFKNGAIKLETLKREYKKNTNVE
jgi:hypothetical protein